MEHFACRQDAWACRITTARESEGDVWTSTGDRILLGVLAVVAAASIWGTLGLFAKILYAQGVSFESLVAVRASVGWVAVMIFVLATGGAGSLRVSGRDLASLAPSRACRDRPVLPALLLYGQGEHGRDGGDPALQLARLRGGAGASVLSEALNAAKVLALFLTAGGIFLVAGAYAPANLEVSPTVLLTGLLSGLTYGLYSIFGRPVAGHLSPSVILSYALFFGSSLLVVAALPTLDTLAGLPAGSYALLLMLAVVHTTLGFALYTFGLGRLGAGRAAIVATVEPVVAGALGMALLGEALTVPKALGAVLVISGAALASAKQVSLLRGTLPAAACQHGASAPCQHAQADAFAYQQTLKAFGLRFQLSSVRAPLCGVQRHRCLRR